MRFNIPSCYKVIVTTVIFLTLTVSCRGAEPTSLTLPSTATIASFTITLVPPTETITSAPALMPPPIPFPPTTKSVPPNPTLLPPTPTPLPPTDTVCHSGCDFTTIQAAIDDTSTEAGAIIELTEPESTDEAKSVTTELVFIGKPNGITDEGIGTLFEQALAEASAPGDNGYIVKDLRAFSVIFA